MYTLIKHLEEYSKTNPEYSILDSIWKLNQKQISQAQNTITFNFPHYSLHERSHSDTIIRNIESFLGEERIKRLSPTDAWLLLMASYTHDLGMVVFQSALEKHWIEQNFQEYLEGLTERSRDNDLKRAATLLLGIEKGSSSYKDKLTIPLEVRKAVILVTAEFFRRNHHQRSLEIISGKNEEFNKLLSGLNIGSLPNRFANVLANIAFAHGIEFYSVLESLEYEANGFSSDKMHPRFIACMLRLGDLLDVDDKRFSIFDQKVFSDTLPRTSQLHKEKHASTRHLLISPESIEVTVDCETDEVYRVAREWFDWLQGEIDNQSREWVSIAPREINGMPPTISKGKLKVLYGSVEPKKELMNLKFAISNEKVFEMFEGSAIYENAEFVFIRELVQNAIDASKIQVWKSVLSGVYDFAIRKHLNLDHNITHDQIVKSIKFPVDLPDSIFENFVVHLNIFWSNENPDELIIEVTDNGTGISEKDLIRMTSKVGESHSKDEAYIKLRKGMPYWLRPTGAFGIGLQSLFLVSPFFTVQSKTEYEEAKEIIFHSAKRGEYSRITGFKPTMNRGTKVSLKINKSRFKDIFSNRFSTTLVENYDHFSDKYGDIYLHKLDQYIKEELSNISLLNATILDNTIIGSRYKYPGNFKSYSEDDKKEKREDQALYTLVSDGYFINFFVQENIFIGSEIKIVFIDSFMDALNAISSPHMLKGSSKYFVRDIPTSEKFPSFYKTNYCSIVWNLESPESDKILNISREKLIDKTRDKYDYKFLEVIFPAIIKPMQSLFEAKHGGVINNNQKVAVTYFHLEMTAKMLAAPINNIENIYNNFDLPSDLVVNESGGSIKFKEFFKYSKFYIISKKYSVSPMPKETIGDVWKTVQEMEKFTSGCVIIKKDYFESYLRLSNYNITSYKVIDRPDGKVVVVTLENVTDYPVVDIDQDSKAYYLRTSSKFHEEKRRNHILPIKQYENIAVKNVSYDGFYDVPRYVKHFIISPFKNEQEILKVYTELESQIEQLDRESVVNLIVKSYLNLFVPEKLIEWVEANSSQMPIPTREGIIRSYAELIIDILMSRKCHKTVETVSSI